MFSKKGFAAVLTAMLFVALAATPAMAAKNFKNLAFAGGYVDRHPTPLNCWLPWMEQAAKDTKGELTFNYFSSGTLYPEKEAFSAVSDGRTDFGVVRASVFPGNMNLMGVMDLPGIAPNSIIGSLVGQELIEQFAEVRAEFPENTVPYFSWASAAYNIHTIQPVKKLEDLKGKKIIVWDAPTLEVIKLLGGNPVRMEGTDSYLALSKAMADGVYCPMAPIRSFKITEACKYHMMVNLGTASFNIFANKTLWDSMPQNLRQWLIDTGGLKMALATGKSLEDGQAVDVKWMEEQGHVLTRPDDAERARWLAKLTPFKEEWVKDCVSRGIKEDVARKVLKYVEERVEFHIQEMRKGVYGDYNV